MDSPAPIMQKLRRRLLPLGAVFMEDLRQTVCHWALLTWVVLGLFCTVLLMATTPAPTSLPDLKQPPALGAPPVQTAPAALMIASASQFAGRAMRYHLLFWASFVVVLGSTAITTEAEIAPNAILCRGVSRWQYYLGKCAARTLAVTIVFVVLTVLAAVLGLARLENDLSFVGLYETIKMGVVLLASLTILSIAGSVWFRSPLIAFAVIWMCLYGLGIVTSVLEVPGISPLLLTDQLPILLRSPDANLSAHYLLPTLLIVAVLGTIVSLTSFCVKDV